MSEKITVTAFDVVRDEEDDLVVRACDMDECYHTIHLDQKLYDELYGAAFPIDITITTGEDNAVTDITVHRAQAVH